MAKYTDAKCRLCRREGGKLFLKGERCFSPKCPLEKKGAVPPGQRGVKGARKLSDFGIQLRAKQKAKRTYGVLEKQFRHYVDVTTRRRGKSVFQILERRLDNVVYRLGFVPSRSVARQIVGHGHVLVDNKKINIPSYLVRPGELVNLDPKSQEIAIVRKFMEDKKYQPPEWLKRQGPVGKVLRLPEKDDLKINIDEQLITEYYSR